MDIDTQCGFAECPHQNYVGRFTPHARKLQQSLERIRDSPTPRVKHSAHGDEMLRLHAMEPDTIQQPLKFFLPEREDLFWFEDLFWLFGFATSVLRLLFCPCALGQADHRRHRRFVPGAGGKRREYQDVEWRFCHAFRTENRRIAFDSFAMHQKERAAQ